MIIRRQPGFRRLLIGEYPELQDPVHDKTFETKEIEEGRRIIEDCNPEGGREFF